MDHAKQQRPAPAPKLAPPRPQAAGVHEQRVQPSTAQAKAAPASASWPALPSGQQRVASVQLKLDPTALDAAMQISEGARQRAAASKSETPAAPTQDARAPSKAEAPIASAAPARSTRTAAPKAVATSTKNPAAPPLKAATTAAPATGGSFSIVRGAPLPPPSRSAFGPRVAQRAVLARPPRRAQAKRGCAKCGSTLDEMSAGTCPTCSAQTSPAHEQAARQPKLMGEGFRTSGSTGHGTTTRQLKLEKPPSPAQSLSLDPARDPAERQADAIGVQIGNDLSGVSTVSSGTLPDGVRAVAQRHLGVDLSGTELRANRDAARQAEGMNALAVTEGSTVSFARGQLNAGSREGRALLGHELTHVAQQKAHGFASPAQAASPSEDQQQGLVPEPEDLGASADVEQTEQLTDALDEDAAPQIGPSAGASPVENPALNEAKTKVAAAPTPAPGTAEAESASAAPAESPVEAQSEAAPAEAAGQAERAKAEVALPAINLGGTPGAVSERAAQALADLSTRARLEIGQIQAASEHTRGVVRTEYAQAKTTARAKISGTRTRLLAAIMQARGQAQAKQVQEAARGEAASDAGTEQIQATGEVGPDVQAIEQQQTGRLTDESKSQSDSAQDKGSEQAGREGGGLLGQLKSSVVVRIGIELGKKIVEGVLAAMSAIGDALSSILSAVFEQISNVASAVMSAVTEVIGQLPGFVQTFFGSLGAVETTVRSKLAALEQQVIQVFDQNEQRALTKIDAAEAGAIRNVLDTYQASATVLQGLVQSGIGEELETARAGLDAQSPDERGSAEARLLELEAAISNLLSDMHGKADDALTGIQLSFAESMAAQESAARAGTANVLAQLDENLARAEAGTRQQIARGGSALGSLLSAVIDEALSFLGDIVTRTGAAVGEFLGDLRQKLADGVSGIVQLASSAVTGLSTTFAEGKRRIASWLAEKLGSLGLPFGAGQAKRVAQRQEAAGDSFWSGVGGELLDTVKSLGLLALAAIAAIVVLALSGPFIVVLGPLMLLAAAGLLIWGLLEPIIQRWKGMEKGGVPTWLRVILIIPIAVADFFGALNIIEAIIGADLLTGETLSADERGKRLTRGLIDLASLGVGKLVKAVAKGVRAGAAGGRAAKAIGKLDELLAGAKKVLGGSKTKPTKAADEVVEGADDAIRRTEKAEAEAPSTRKKDSNDLTQQQANAEIDHLAKHPELVTGKPPNRTAKLGEHTWKEQEGGIWCRHSSGEYCTKVPDDLLTSPIEVSFGPDHVHKFREVSERLRKLARRDGVELPKKPTKPETQAAMRDYINQVVRRGQTVVGPYKPTGGGDMNAQWTIAGDTIVIRRSNGQFLTVLDATDGGQALNFPGGLPPSAAHPASSLKPSNTR